MPFLLLLIGALIVVSAAQNTQGSLFTALETDVPKFLVWALAVVAVGGLGYVPGLRTTSRWLLALVLLVIFLANYQKLLAGLTSLTPATASSTGTAVGGTAVETPAAAAAANPLNPSITTAEVTGSGKPSATTQLASAATAPLFTDPAAFLTEFEAGIGGFGGVA